MEYLSEQSEWKPEEMKGHVTVVTAGCGQGKSTAVLGLALNETFLLGGKMLFLTTRSADVEKLRIKIESGGLSNVIPRTIQGLEEEIERDNIDAVRYLSAFSCVVVDEAHYWVSDSAFSRSTELSYKAVKQYADDITSGSGKTLILISATPENLGSLFSIDTKICLPPNTSHIGSITFIPQSDYIDQMVREILRAKREGKKGIIFFQKKSEMVKTKDALKEFGEENIVSLFSAKRKRIVADKDGEYKIPKGKTAILATSVLAFGVDFWETEIDFVATNASDALLAVQELGRKRCKEGERINLFVADYSKKNLRHVYTRFVAEMQEADAFFSAPKKFDGPYRDGGQWREGWEKSNRCIRMERFTYELKKSDTHRAFCMRIQGLIEDLDAEGETWQKMLLKKMGYQSVSEAPVRTWQSVVDKDVTAEINRMKGIKYPTSEDWERVAVALRAKLICSHSDITDADYKNGKNLKQPKAIGKRLERYGYTAGKRKRYRLNGTLVTYYPLVCLNNENEVNMQKIFKEIKEDWKELGIKW